MVYSGLNNPNDSFNLWVRSYHSCAHNLLLFSHLMQHKTCELWITSKSLWSEILAFLWPHLFFLSLLISIQLHSLLVVPEHTKYIPTSGNLLDVSPAQDTFPINGQMAHPLTYSTSLPKCKGKNLEHTPFLLILQTFMEK